MISLMERVRQLEHELEEVRGKFFDLKQDKKLAAVFFEELWRKRWEELADAVDKMGTSYLPQDIIDARQRVEALLRDVRSAE